MTLEICLAILLYAGYLLATACLLFVVSIVAYIFTAGYYASKIKGDNQYEK
jgi:uncharacterized membrane protein YphA (DoxX/SURF4 family)